MATNTTNRIETAEGQPGVSYRMNVEVSTPAERITHVSEGDVFVLVAKTQRAMQEQFALVGAEYRKALGEVNGALLEVRKENGDLRERMIAGEAEREREKELSKAREKASSATVETLSQRVTELSQQLAESQKQLALVTEDYRLFRANHRHDLKIAINGYAAETWTRRVDDQYKRLLP